MAPQLERAGNILAYICCHGPVNRYDIRNKAGRIGSPRVFYESIRRLEALGFIEPTSDSQSKSQDAYPQYVITQRGFILYLRICAQFDKSRLKTQVDISDVAKRYPKFLPRIFPLWKEFKAQGIREIAERLLIRLALSAYLDTLLPSNFLKYFERKQKQRLRPPGSDAIADLMENSFFDLQNMAYVTMKWRDRVRWYEALKIGPELSRPFVESARAKTEFERSKLQFDELRLRILANGTMLKAKRPVHPSRNS